MLCPIIPKWSCFAALLLCEARCIEKSGEFVISGIDKGSDITNAFGKIKLNEPIRTMAQLFKKHCAQGSACPALQCCAQWYREQICRELRYKYKGKLRNSSLHHCCQKAFVFFYEHRLVTALMLFVTLCFLFSQFWWTQEKGITEKKIRRQN